MMVMFMIVVFFNKPATTDIYTYCDTLSLHDALPICCGRVEFQPGRYAPEYIPAAAQPADRGARRRSRSEVARPEQSRRRVDGRSEEHTSELQSLMRISYAVFCLKKKKPTHKHFNIMY